MHLFPASKDPFSGPLDLSLAASAMVVTDFIGLWLWELLLVLCKNTALKWL